MSWNGTVRCSNCYTSGHNRTGCPELKKAYDADPNSYDGKQWARIMERKAKPKTCSYCQEQGHTRAGCADLKAHKQTYQEEAILFRQAIAKWMRESGLGIGALVRAQDVSYYTEKGHLYPNDENYVPPVGMIMNTTPSADHYTAVSGSGPWLQSGGLLTMELLGSTEDSYRRNVGLGLPCIPGIVPRMGKDWYGGFQDRADRTSGTNWEVVSPGCKHFDGSDWTSTKVVAAVAKEHFGRDNEETRNSFQTLPVEQKEQMLQYVNDEIELSEMSDPILPDNDS